MNWAKAPRPIVCLAPMDGYTDSPFRRVVRQVNPQVVLFSEFTSADGFLRAEKVRQRLDFNPQERPFFVQLFGNNPQTFAEASRQLEQAGVTGIDINMGCPAKRIVASQHGSGLMRDPDAACRVVEAVAQATRLPVSVKTRLGWSGPDNLLSFTRLLANAGASLITIHGRTYRQGYSGQADWAPIHPLKAALGVTVVGNGDVRDYADGLERMGPLDGFMIGRASLGNPWAFLPPGAPMPGWAEKSALMVGHFLLMRAEKDEVQAVREFRKHLGPYVKGLPHAKALRQELLAIEREKPLLKVLEGLAALEDGGQNGGQEEAAGAAGRSQNRAEAAERGATLGAAG